MSKEEREKGYNNIKRLRTRAERGKNKGGRTDAKPDAQADGLELAAQRDDYLGWLEARKISEMTIDHRRNDLELFFGWAADRSLRKPGEITLAILEAYQRHIANYRKKNGKPLANRSQQKRLGAVKDYFRYLVRHGILPANPASELILPKKETPLPEQGLTQSQIDDVLNQPDVADELGIRDRAMLEVLCATAIRRSELARLELQDLNREAETLRIRLPKSKRDRIVPVGSSALHWCERYLEEVRPKLEIDQAETALFLTGYGAGSTPTRSATGSRNTSARPESRRAEPT